MIQQLHCVLLQFLGPVQRGAIITQGREIVQLTQCILVLLINDPVLRGT